jgi:hypothetical protein
MSKCRGGQKHSPSTESFDHVEIHDGKEETLTSVVTVCGRCGRLLKEKKKRKVRILRRR